MSVASRITDVRLRPLAARADEPIAMSFGALEYRRMGLVEISTSDGLTGCGETWINYPDWAAKERLATVRDGIAPLLVGEALTGVRPIVHALRSRLNGLGRQWGAPGPIQQAISGVEIALLDLLARQREVSIAELLGGVTRTEIPVYASGLSPGNAGALAARNRSEGFTAVKCRVGFGIDTDLATVAEVREQVGDDIDLFVDANQAWSLPQAVRMVRLLEPYGIRWFEEAVTGNRVEDFVELFRLTGAGIAAGENAYGLDAFARLISSSAVAVLQPDVSKVGGIRETDIICSLAGAAGTPVVPHWYGGPVALAATLQLAAAAPEIETVEFDVRDNPLMEVVSRETFRVKDGHVRLPEGTGLGITLDEDAVGAFEEAAQGAVAP